MTDAAEEDAKYVLFEFLDAATVSFRRSDMDYPDVRRQFLELLSFFLAVEMTPEEWSHTLAQLPDEWGEYLGFGIGKREKSRVEATIFRVDREPGVNSGENTVITSIAIVPTQ
jgi:hypothetical protein